MRPTRMQNGTRSVCRSWSRSVAESGAERDRAVVAQKEKPRKKDRRQVDDRELSEKLDDEKQLLEQAHDESEKTGSRPRAEPTTHDVATDLALERIHFRRKCSVGSFLARAGGSRRIQLLHIAQVPKRSAVPIKCWSREISCSHEKVNCRLAELV